ncbi:MAG: tetratricopeptide repeat protein [Bacteroidales bacterium]
MKKIASLIVLVSVHLFLTAQSNPDSLYTLWQDSNQPDSIRVKAYHDYIYQGFLYTNPDSAIVLANQLIKYGDNKNFPKANGFAYSLQGLANFVQGNYTQAIEEGEKSLRIFEEIEDKKGIAESLNNIGNAYINSSNFDQALAYQEKSIIISEEIGYTEQIASSLNSVGNIYLEQGNYAKALDYYKRSVKIFEEIGDSFDWQ